LSNAVKFSPPKSQVRVVVRTVEDGIKLSISDQGPGIAPRNLRHLFEPHWQASPANIGWGLGLAIARSIILGHGGRIGVDSEVGGGTTFHVWLPLPNRPVARPLATATTELVADPPPSPSGEHPKSVVA
jgi:signal transduction histidine kinase